MTHDGSSEDRLRVIDVEGVVTQLVVGHIRHVHPLQPQHQAPALGARTERHPAVDAVPVDGATVREDGGAA